MAFSALEKFPKSKMLYLLLFVFAFLLYVNTVPNDYNIDDEIVTKGHRLTSKGIKSIPEIVTSHYYQDESGYAYEYRPITLASFAIEHQFLGENPHVSHLINVLIYALSGIILFILLQSLLPNRSEYFHLTVCLLFLAHPMHTEVVASIKNRDELLALLFALISWIYAVRFSVKANFFALILSVIFFTAAILSKLSIVNLSLLIPLSVVIFNKPKLANVFLLSFLFSILIYVISPLEQVNIKILYVLLVLITPVSIGFLMNVSFPINGFKAYLSKFSHPKELYGKIQGELAFPVIFFLCVLPALFLFLGVYYWQDKLVHFGLVLPLFYLLLFNKKYNSFFLIVWALLLPFMFHFLYDKQTITFLMSVLIFLYTTSLIKKTKLNFVVLSLLLVIATIYVQLSVIPVALIFLSTLVFDVKKTILLALVLFVSYFVYRLTYGTDTIFYIIPLLISLAFGSSLLLKSRVYTGILLLISFVFLANLDYTHISDYDRGAILTNENLKAVDINVQHAMNGQDRPLTYLEAPINSETDLESRFATSMYVLGVYLKKMFLPVELGFYYGYAYIEPVDMSNLYALISLVIHILLIILAIACLKKHPVLSFGILFYLGCIFLFSNLFYPVVGVIGDRFTYVASIGLILAVVYLLFEIFKIDKTTKLSFKTKPVFFIILTTLISISSVKTFARNLNWKDPLTLMEHDIVYLDNSAQAHNLLALNLLLKYSENNSSTYLDKAEKHLERSTEVYPEFFNTQYDLGKVLVKQGKYKDAAIAFEKAIEIDPSYNEAVVKVASIYMSLGIYDKAVVYFQKAVQNQPNQPKNYGSLAFALFQLGDLERSIQVGRETTSRFPHLFDPWSNLGKIYYKMGNIPMTIECFEKAFEIKKDVNVAMVLSSLYRSQENTEMALYYESFTQ